jgi:hypothetical protein
MLNPTIRKEPQMAQYMLLIYDDATAWQSMSEDERNAVMGEYFSYTQALRDAGAFVAGDALHPTSTAKSVRVRDDDREITDGPFAETKEHLGGYYLVDVETEDEALEWAAKIPSARFGTIEVRPVVVFPASVEAGA